MTNEAARPIKRCACPSHIAEGCWNQGCNCTEHYGRGCMGWYFEDTRPSPAEEE